MYHLHSNWFVYKFICRKCQDSQIDDELYYFDKQIWHQSDVTWFKYVVSFFGVANMWLVIFSKWLINIPRCSNLIIIKWIQLTIIFKCLNIHILIIQIMLKYTWFSSGNQKNPFGVGLVVNLRSWSLFLLRF